MKHTQTVVVTGAAKSGIGEAITRKLLAQGYQVIGTYQPEDSDQATALLAELEGLPINLHAVNHADRASLARFVRQIKEPIHALVNAQFFFEMENPENYDHALWDKLIAINLTAPNYLSRQLEPKIVAGGSILTITSTEGFMGSFGGAAYAACKAGIHNLVKTHANNFGPRGIRVNAIAAGWIGGVEDTLDIFNKSREITPLGRLGTGEEIAEVALFLISDKASFINGAVVVADGGYSGVDTLAKYEYEEFQKSDLKNSNIPSKNP